MVAVKSKGPTMPTYRMWHNHNATSQMLALTVSRWRSTINGFLFFPSFYALFPYKTVVAYMYMYILMNTWNVPSL